MWAYYRGKNAKIKIRGCRFGLLWTLQKPVIASEAKHRVYRGASLRSQ
jgi:hypothetical protein